MRVSNLGYRGILISKYNNSVVQIIQKMSRASNVEGETKRLPVQLAVRHYFVQTFIFLAVWGL